MGRACTHSSLPSSVAAAAVKPRSASSAATMPFRAASPTLTLFAMVPRLSISPHAWVAPRPIARTIRSASSASSLPTAVAAPITPQVLVMCQPRS